MTEHVTSACQNQAEGISDELQKEHVRSLAAWSSGMILVQGARGPGFNSRSSPFLITAWHAKETTARGFEPLRAEPNGFRVHLLNRSDTLSWSKDVYFIIKGKPRCGHTRVVQREKEHIRHALEREQQLLVWPNG